MADATGAKKIPKGAPPKGGTRFPRYDLSQAINWAKRLVSKTHQSPQPADVVFAAVVEAKGATASIRISAIKQFNLLQGESSAYDATDLAKEINSVPKDEQQPLLARAALSPEIFKNIFNTFEGHGYTKGKIRQRALELKVHPDNVDKCVDVYCDSMKYAGLVSLDGENVLHHSIQVNQRSSTPILDEATDLASSENYDAEEGGDGSEDADLSIKGRSQGAVFNVNVTLDSSLDIEKLERHLSLLKRFGVI